jgi:PAS domain S-box-containing protein
MTATLHRDIALHRTALLAGILVAALGLSVLLGWTFDISALKSVFPGLVTMKANAALEMLLSGFALALLSSGKAGMPVRFCVAGMAVAVITIGAMTLGEYIFGWEPGMDQWLFQDALNPVETLSPGRMSPATAFCLVLTGGALLVALRPVATRWGFPIIEAMGAAIIVVGGFALSGFGLNALFGLRWWSHAGIAIPTAAGLMLLGSGLLAFAKSEGGLKWALGAWTTGGFVLGIISLLAAVEVFCHLTNQLQQRAGWVVHTQEVLKKSEAVTADVAALGSSVRAYINTGDERLPKQAEEMKGAVRNSLDGLRILTADNPRQQERLVQINALIARCLDWDEQLIAVRRKEGLSAAGQIIAKGTGVALVDSIRGLVNDMEEEESSLLDQRQEKEQRISTTTSFLLPLGGFFSITLLCLGLFYLNAGVGERARTEGQLAAIVESSADAIIGKNLQGIVTSWNAGAERIFGYTAREMIGQPITRLISSACQEEETDFLVRIHRGDSARQFETERVRKDGSLVPVSITISPIKDSTGKIVGASKVARDITERRRMDLALSESNENLKQRNRELSGQTEALRASEEKFRQLAENINEICWIAAADESEVLFISPAYERIWGRTCQSLYENPRSFLEGIHEADRVRVSSGLEALKRGEKHDVEYRVVRPDGQIRWVHDRGAAIRDESGAIYRLAGIAEDITLRKSTDAQLRQAQKMEAVGQLAGGVAHDFNNILTIICGNLDLLLMTETNLQPESRQYLSSIATATDRATGLTRQLLAFSRREAMQMQVLDLNDLVASFIKLLRRILGEDIRVLSEFAAALPPIIGDPGMIEQILMNLAINARDAMPSGGKLIIGTELKEIDLARAQMDPRNHQGRFACLTVRDTGTGIAPGNISRIFEPFFTTKGVGKGTGLGLATVFGIVEHHRGWVDVSSEVGVGTTFSVFLPVTSEELVVPGAAARKTVRGGGEKILVVEDDKAVRDVMTETLQRLGYDVVEADSGVAVMRIWAKEEREFDLLLTDMVMPGGVTGLNLVELLRLQKPGLKVVLTSGYSSQLIASDVASANRLAFLKKPFSPQALAETVRKSLDAREPAVPDKPFEMSVSGRVRLDCICRGETRLKR